MLRTTLRIAVLTGVLVLANQAYAQGGGFILYEQGDPASGAAHAGQSALALDASTTYLNPAGMTRMAGGFLIGGQALKLSAQFETDPGTTVSGGGGSDAGRWLPGGGAYGVFQVGERIWLGIGAYVPAGLILTYDDDWAGRYYIREGKLAVINVGPTMAYKISDKVSIGGGIDLQWSKFAQRIGVNRLIADDGEVEIDLDSFAVGFNLGLLFEVDDDTRFGVKYRSKVTHSLSGDVGVLAGFDTNAATDLPIPQAVNVSLYHGVSPTVTLLMDVGWTVWSTFDTTLLSAGPEGAAVVVIPRDWDDTWRLGLGMHVQASDDWLLQFGGSYDGSPTDLERRTPDLPADRQWRLSAGAQRRRGDAGTWGFSYTYANFGSNAVDVAANPRLGRLKGEFSPPMTAHIIGAYISWGGAGH